MQKTSNFNLNKPEATDPMRLEDFNHNADIVDGLLAAGAKVAVGLLAGDGKYGENNPSVVDFGFVPKVVFVKKYDSAQAPAIFFQGETANVYYYYGNIAAALHPSWRNEGKTLSWYSEVSADQQMSLLGLKYYYIALG